MTTDSPNNASLIARLEALKISHGYKSPEQKAIDACISVIHAYASDPQVMEKVARALCIQYQIDDGYGPDSGKYGDMWKNFRKQAKAAIEAMNMGAPPSPANTGEVSLLSQIKNIISGYKWGENLHETALAIESLVSTHTAKPVPVSLEKCIEAAHILGPEATLTEETKAVLESAIQQGAKIYVD